MCNDQFVMNNETNECETCSSKYGASCHECNAVQCTECLANYYIKDMECTACPENCEECINGTCEECEDGFFLNVNRSCQPCSSTCEECLSATVCSECNDGSYLNLSISACMDCP